MHSVYRSFADERQFYQNFLSESSTLITHSSNDLRIFEKVSVHLGVISLNTRTQISGRIMSRTLIEDETPFYRYVVRLDPQDRVWFDAFVTQIDTLSKFTKDFRLSA